MIPLESCFTAGMLFPLSVAAKGWIMPTVLSFASFGVLSLTKPLLMHMAICI